jgi:hypothetical protein
MASLVYDRRSQATAEVANRLLRQGKSSRVDSKLERLCRGRIANGGSDFEGETESLNSEASKIKK